MPVVHKVGSLRLTWRTWWSTIAEWCLSTHRWDLLHILLQVCIDIFLNGGILLVFRRLCITSYYATPIVDLRLHGGILRRSAWYPIYVSGGFDVNGLHGVNEAGSEDILDLSVASRTILKCLGTGQLRGRYGRGLVIFVHFFLSSLNNWFMDVIQRTIIDLRMHVEEWVLVIVKVESFCLTPGFRRELCLPIGLVGWRSLELILQGLFCYNWSLSELSWQSL